MTSPLLLENVWLQQQKFEDAELVYRQSRSGPTNSCCNVNQKSCNSLAGEIAQVRHEIKKALDKPVPATECQVVSANGDNAVYRRLDDLEKENKDLRQVVNELRAIVISIQASIKGSIEEYDDSVSASPKHQEPEVPKQSAVTDDDDDCDLFGSDDEEAKALKEKRLKEYAEKKAKKTVIIAKSSILLDVKPWDDETDMVEMEKRVRSIQQDGLAWGASKLVPVGYGIRKLSILCVVEDDKVSVEDLSEKITEDNDDLVQSVDVAAFNKI